MTGFSQALPGRGMSAREEAEAGPPRSYFPTPFAAADGKSNATLVEWKVACGEICSHLEPVFPACHLSTLSSWLQLCWFFPIPGVVSFDF